MLSQRVFLVVLTHLSKDFALFSVGIGEGVEFI